MDNVSNDQNEPNNRIIVHNLSFETDENGLREYFSKYGDVSHVEIPISQSQNRSRGFGFVTFSDVEDAIKANDPNLTHEINERKVRTNFANKRGEKGQGGEDSEYRVKKLYIGKLPKEINEEELKVYFEQFGKVKDAFLSSVKFAPLLNGFPQHKGYGFVTFEVDEDANKAVKHKSHVIKGTNIFVRKAIPQKDDENSPKSGERRNRAERKNNNKGGERRNNDRRRDRKEGGSSSSSATSSPSTTKPTTPSSSNNTNTQQSSTPSTTPSSNNTESTEKKAVVVKRKEESGSNNSSPSTTPSTASSSNNTTSEKKNESPSNNNSSSNNTSTVTNSKSSSSSNNNKSTTTNQAPKNTKPVFQIQKTSTSNPWKTQSSESSKSQTTNDFPGLSKKKGVKKTTPPTTTTTTPTVTNSNPIDDKEDIEDN